MLKCIRFSALCCVLSASLLLTGGALWWMMANNDESPCVRTAVECTECMQKGWSPLSHCHDDPGVSRGPHVQCTQPPNSLTPQLEAYWKTICHLPGIQLRVTANGNFWQHLKALIYFYIAVHSYRFIKQPYCKCKSRFCLIYHTIFCCVIV